MYYVLVKRAASSLNANWFRQFECENAEVNNNHFQDDARDGKREREREKDQRKLEENEVVKSAFHSLIHATVISIRDWAVASVLCTFCTQMLFHFT